jgi:hypothetical protein
MPSSFTSYGSLNGTTPVLLQAPPDQGSLIVRELYIRNTDTMPVGLHVYASNGLQDVEVFAGILRVGYMLQMSKDVIILNTSTSLYAVLDAAPATTQPTYKIGYAFENQI